MPSATNAGISGMRTPVIAVRIVGETEFNRHGHVIAFHGKPTHEQIRAYLIDTCDMVEMQTFNVILKCRSKRAFLKWVCRHGPMRESWDIYMYDISSYPEIPYQSITPTRHVPYYDSELSGVV